MSASAGHAGEGLNFPGRSTLGTDTTLGPPRQYCPRLQTFARPRFLEASSVPLQLWLGMFCLCYVLLLFNVDGTVNVNVSIKKY